MRTTVELLPDLLRAAKARAAERGESLKALLSRAVAADLADEAPAARMARGRVSLPIFGRPSGTRTPLTNRDLELALAQADAHQIRNAIGSQSGTRTRKRR
jgi:hypothetical protein